MPSLLPPISSVVREALKILEFQGLTTNKTSPGGGVLVVGVDTEQAIKMVDNLFLFHSPSIPEIYAMRKVLEPQLAASIARRLSPEAFVTLQDKIRLYEEEPKTAGAEYGQRLAELDFPIALARNAENTLLGFTCIFLVSLCEI